jgi:two-component system nitrate/nitrite response regulator NarL
MMAKNKTLTPLTAREHDVARLLIQGNSNKLIAANLGISDHTAKFHVNNFISKMGAQTRVDAAVKYALANIAAREQTVKAVA